MFAITRPSALTVASCTPNHFAWRRYPVRGAALRGAKPAGARVPPRLLDHALICLAARDRRDAQAERRRLTSDAALLSSAIALPLRPRTQSRSYRAIRSRRVVSPSKHCSFELAHDHPDVLLPQVLSPVTRNRDHNAGFVAEAPMARSLATEVAEAVIQEPGCERFAGAVLIGEFSDSAASRRTAPSVSAREKPSDPGVRVRRRERYSCRFATRRRSSTNRRSSRESSALFPSAGEAATSAPSGWSPLPDDLRHAAGHWPA
jgi:hypothetical protein